MIEVTDAGPLTLVQDVGRPGHAAVGVSPSGALDARAFADANRLVGNRPDAAVLELLLGPVVLHARAPLWLAVTGARGPVTVRGRPAPLDRAFPVGTGEDVAIGRAELGLRYYVGARGGLDVPTVLGSRSTDTLSGLGPAPVRSGAVLAVASAVGLDPVPPVDWLPTSTPDGIAHLRVRPGPRRDWFAASAWHTLLGQPWTVSPQSDRVGLRLGGRPLERRVHDELPSEGTVTGALQVPPSGEPILFLADHPTTGGYPVIGAVASADLPLAAQLRPGERVRFVGARL